ncbi:MAG TPA: TIGR03618 family F420-dependent PPOX class oxidoreductase [Acidimicrobiia bacterium]|nr:TIGR03618 family F420-dependent PPOX class oxidoreductase [Acidimicrobiia bacterium]
MAFDPQNLPDAAVAFLRERHLGTLTTTGPDGRLHVVAIAFTYEPADGLIRMITFGTSQKVRNLRQAGAGARAAVGQVDGPRWLSFEGPAIVVDDPERVGRAVALHATRYKQPGENPRRVAIELTPERVLGRL